jgi:nitrite reductase/ring-hydroxylating ferredoxin subunit
MGEERQFLCTLDELKEGSSKGFSTGELEGFLVRLDGRVYAYRNRCPHVGAPLDWMPDNFLTKEGDFIQCAMHGALFRIESGECVHGPCVEQRLESLEVELVGGRIYL